MTTAPIIGAIQTTYKGIKFRSRTEARWAVFFDVLDIEWEYEPEAYSDGESVYLPDFWLPTYRFFWEVKGIEVFDRNKVGIAVNATGRLVAVAVGQPKEPAIGSFQIEIIHPYTDHPLWGAWAQCNDCRQIGFFTLDASENWKTFSNFWQQSEKHCAHYETEACTPKLLNAFVNARAHRFWDPKS